MNKLTAITKTPFGRLSQHQARGLSVGQQLYFKKNLGFDKDKVDREPTLMENAPDWKQSTATESEADIKAEKEPDVPPEILKEETAEWVRSHKDKDGNIPPQ
ncbi:proteasome core particle subunit beta 3 [Mucor velutinosus]|uniref:Proteasome core particle subunit beta 3 n=1 Tax=Mucor velutinosus TaxID=708070 RepID=A0AAN7DR18_9FUNG|nr:proteasome core particle subunit beta 3 [Mucor velutinosus]